MAIQCTDGIKKSVLFRCGELTDGTSPYDSKALDYMNQVYRSILSGGNEFNLDLGKPWVWAKARQPGTLVLQPQYETGTVTVTNGSTAISFSVAPPAAVVGQWIQIGGSDGDFFKIVSIAGVNAVLDAAYTGSSASGASFIVYYLEYDLSPAIERLIGPMFVDQQQEFNAPEDGLVYGVDIGNIYENYPLKFIDILVPNNFAQIAKTQDGKIRVRFNSQVGSQTKVNFDYIPVYSDLKVFSCTASGSTISATAHGLSNGQAVTFPTAPSGLSTNTIYFVVNAATNSFSVSSSYGGTAIGGIVSSSGTVSMVPVIPQAFAQILDYAASYYIMTDKNDERATQYAQLASQKMQAMISANSREMGQTGGIRYGGLIARLDMFSGPRRYWRQTVK